MSINIRTIAIQGKIELKYSTLIFHYNRTVWIWARNDKFSMAAG